MEFEGGGGKRGCDEGKVGGRGGAVGEEGATRLRQATVHSGRVKAKVPRDAQAGLVMTTYYF